MEEDVAGDEVTAMAEALGVSVTRAAAMARAAGGVEGAVAAFYGDPTAPPPPPPDGDNDVDVLRAMLGPAAPSDAVLRRLVASAGGVERAADAWFASGAAAAIVDARDDEGGGGGGVGGGGDGGEGGIGAGRAGAPTRVAASPAPPALTDLHLALA